MNENQQICFTDSTGKELFSLPDNGVLCLFYGNGDTHFSLCRFLDQSHAEIDGVKYCRPGICPEDGTHQNQLCPGLTARGQNNRRNLQ